MSSSTPLDLMNWEYLTIHSGLKSLFSIFSMKSTDKTVGGSAWVDNFTEFDFANSCKSGGTIQQLFKLIWQNWGLMVDSLYSWKKMSDVSGVDFSLFMPCDNQGVTCIQMMFLTSCVIFLQMNTPRNSFPKTFTLFVYILASAVCLQHWIEVD